MGMAVTFVIALSSVITYLVQYAILVPLHIEYMQTIAFILVIAGLVQLVEMFIQKMCIRDRSKSYPEKPLFRELDLTLRKGEKVAVLGPKDVYKRQAWWLG